MLQYLKKHSYLPFVLLSRVNRIEDRIYPITVT